METLFSYNQQLLTTINRDFERFLSKKVNWNQRMIALTGPRGAGKTTLMLQRQKYELDSEKESLYVTIDHPYFYENTLFELAQEFSRFGGKVLFIDEIHKYERWSKELKVIYDGFPSLKVVFSASSALDIFRGEADLSRRVLTYELPGMSFREFLEFRYGFSIEALSIKDLAKSHVDVARKIASELTILPLFQEYLKIGYLPISKENPPEDYWRKLQQIINTIIDTDMAYTEGYTVSTATKLKRLLGILAASAPYEPNISELSRKIGIGRDRIYLFLRFLEKGKLLNFLFTGGKALSHLQKPDKIYIENTNLSFALNSNPSSGNLRETFVLNQLLNAGFDVKYPKSGDFEVEDFTVEVGGKKKSRKQVYKAPNPLIASDDIDIGFGEKIPLWMFGLLY